MTENPLYLNKIVSDKKAIECAAIFNKVVPTPSELRWLLKFLKFAGYSKVDVQDIMRKYAQWSDYGERVASHQLEAIFYDAHTIANP